MSAACRRLTLLLALCAAGSPAFGAAGRELALEVTARSIEGARVVEATLPGWVLDLVPVPGSGLAILAAAGDAAQGPRSIFLLDPAAGGSLTEIVGGLSPEIDAVGRLPGTSPALVAGEAGKLHLLEFSEAAGAAAPRTILEAPGFDLAWLERRGLVTASGIFLPGIGRLSVFELAADGSFRHGPGLDLPPRVRRERSGLRFEVPPVTVLELGGAPWVAVGPGARGRRRLLTTLLDPRAPPPARAAAAGTPTGGERWSLLPSPEAVEESFYLTVDGRPMLAVATLSADRIGIFERKKLRVFPLWSDRTRAGARPTLQADTTSRRWQPVAVEVLDLSGDGHDDLAVLQRDGLAGKKLVVEVYSGQGNGGFYSTSRRTVVTAPDAAWRYGRDVTGDGRPDLVALSRGRLLIFAGVDHRLRVVEKKAGWTFEPSPAAAAGGVVATLTVAGGDAGIDVQGPAWEEAPELVDVDGDGLDEIVTVSPADTGSVLRIFELR